MNAFTTGHVRLIVLFLVIIFSLYTNFSRAIEGINNNFLSADYDGYWHLLRVTDIHNSGNWNNDINYRGNAPFGERIHWTHSMDIVLLSGAYIGSFFTSFDSALRWFGVIVGPLFYILSLLAVIYFGCFLLGRRYGIYLALLFAMQYINQSIFSANRPDHHCLVGFLYIVYFFSLTSLVAKPNMTSLSLLAGMVGALGLWAGMEVLVLIGLSIIYLGLLWIIEGNKYLRPNILLTTIISVGIIILFIFDGESDNYYLAVYDKLSIFHVSLFFTIMLYWFAASRLTKVGIVRGIQSRVVIAIGGVTFVTLMCLYLFPGIVNGAFGQLDPRIRTLYLDKTGEFGISPKIIIHNFLLLGPGLIYLLHSIFRKDDNNRHVSIWMILTICVYLGLGSTMARWLYTLGIISIIPNLLILKWVLSWTSTTKNAVFAFVFIIILLCVPLLPVSHVTHQKNETDNKEYNFELVNMLLFLESQVHKNEREIILANIYIGPAIMYHTSYNVVGTPNHSNADGIIDTYRILNAKDNATAWSLIEERGINYILSDNKLLEFANINIDNTIIPAEKQADDAFIYRLTNGDIPEWISVVPLPEELSSTFSLYRIVDI